MHYQEFTPPPHLAKYVRYFWTLESDGPQEEVQTFRPIADGCPGLIYQPGFRDETNKELPDLFLYGQTTTQVDLTVNDKINAAGIYFQPDVLRTLFNLNAVEHTNGCLDPDLLSGKQHDKFLSEKLLSASSPANKIAVLSDYVLSLLKRNNLQEDDVTQYALSRIHASNGILSLKDLHEEIRLSERTLERKFREQVGISAGLYARICRFQSALDQLRQNNYDKLSDIAYDNEYADQSHFIRAFKEFAGSTPNQFQKSASELVKNFPVVSHKDVPPRRQGTK